MNKIINNIALIADAAEYFDRRIGSAWKIRAMLTNMVVYAARSLMYARKAEDRERECKAMVILATLRCWVKDANNSSLVLDLTPGAVSRTLGIGRITDPHAEACRIARAKCLQRRNATNFKAFYNEALNQLEEQEARKTADVEEIANLISDNSFEYEGEFTDNRGVSTMYMNLTSIPDTDLYDEDSVERQLDQLAEGLGNTLETMYVECERELAGAITTNKISRLEGYFQGINQMMNIVGVDTKKMADRQIKLEQLVQAEMDKLATAIVDVDAQIEQQMMEMAKPEPEPEPAKAPKRGMVKGPKKDITVDQFCDILAANK